MNKPKVFQNSYFVDFNDNSTDSDENHDCNENRDYKFKYFTNNDRFYQYSSQSLTQSNIIVNPLTSRTFSDGDKYQHKKQSFDDLQNSSSSHFNDQTRRSSQSAWSKWSQDRRSLSNRGAKFCDGRNVKIASLFDQLTQTQRTPTPIMKAREESKNLVAPEIAETYIPLDQSNMNRKQSCPRVVSHHRRGAISYQTISSTAKLSYSEIQLLHEYWDHHNFIKSRKWGLCSGLLSMGLNLFSVSSTTWLKYGDKKAPDHEGLWLKCNAKNNTCLLTMQSLALMPNYFLDWQKAVLFLIILGTLCIIFATFFSFGGLFKKHLPNKLYYYHSGAEFYFVGSLTSGGGLLIYSLFLPKIISLNHDWLRYGHAFSLGWISVFLALIAFGLLRLDEFVQQLSQPIHWRESLNKLVMILFWWFLPSSSSGDKRGRTDSEAEQRRFGETGGGVNDDDDLNSPGISTDNWKILAQLSRLR